MDNETLLHKYLNGEASAEEVAQLKADPEYSEYVRIAEVSAGFETPDFHREAVYEKITAAREAQSVKQLPNSKEKTSNRTIWIAIAAAFVALVAGYFYISNQGETFSTDIAQRETIALPDGSEVVLNAASELRYNTKSWSENRTLQLNGEAFFDVEKGSTFTVDTPRGTVEVLGTEFNVFSRDSLFTVQCYEGSVAVTVGSYKTTLSPNQEIRFVKDALLSENSVAGEVPSWMILESTFKNATLGIVLAELQRQYDISVSADKALLTKKLNVSFPHDNLELALLTIVTPLQLTYDLNDKEVHIYAE
ncbi:FecR domain-containing protein [Luteirhabdus pelagi]|uniref:FecR domain-containing protein n=1 Tax=Luteirhabdus pelagi TaxID=2792783 RepID=UPI0019392885|nr:FecR domain-containing protein [Luteirhabdus pelagi]